MSTLYLDRKNLTVKLDGQALALYEEGNKRGTVPLKMLERVVIRGNIHLESQLLCALSQHQVDVLCLTGRQSGRGAMAFGSTHNDIKRRLGQYHSFWDKPAQLSLARQLVLGKCAKQRQFIQQALAKRADLRQVLSKADSRLQTIEQRLLAQSLDILTVEQLRGFEGAAAVAYFAGFKALFAASLQFSKRQRRPPPDPVNAVLSLGYTLLHYEAVGICHIVGLEPLLGFYHEPAYGRESLACDLIEPLRPRLDALVWSLFKEKILRSEHFSNDDNRCLLNKVGRKHFYAHYERFAQPIRRLLRLQGYQLAQFYCKHSIALLEKEGAEAVCLTKSPVAPLFQSGTLPEDR